MPPRKQPTKVDPILLGRLLKQRKATGLVIVLAIIVCIAVLDRGAGLLPVQDDWHKYHKQSFEVLRVVDGDTLELRVPDGDRKTTSVRLWGVDTPEMGRADRGAEPEPFAEEATAFARRHAEGRRVTIYLQEHRLRGNYGRLLAYVELPDRRILNAALIENGLSEHDDRWGHEQADAYDELERQARKDRRGQWAP